MTTALYRRYRPDSFADVIGQEHVTDPLRAALRADRATHAYLFSGPRGCGKTTSARILARCLNCAEGPTDTPCGVCESCVELARGGPGSLDVVEIDAASHGGVDDARDLRERAVFAPARDRYKVFVIDEAHMVTTQGFNALLKLVEEPPAHVKFVFATTEPEKVIGTIRSRTHHYPFRLVPPAVLQDYLAQLCQQEGISVESGVLPLVVRAGGGSVRDSLSVLDQLLAGAQDGAVGYQVAAALLGFTPSTLLDDAVSALAAGDGGSLFRVVDHLVESGRDPRRFVEDLLDRLRDLIVLAAAGAEADAVLRAIPSDELERMRPQARQLGARQLSLLADIVNTGLTEMVGATSPRLQLELILTRALIALGALGAAPAPAPVTTAQPASPAPAPSPAATPPATTAQPAATSAAPVPSDRRDQRDVSAETRGQRPVESRGDVSAETSQAPPQSPVPAEAPAPAPSVPVAGSASVDAAELRRRWPEVLDQVAGLNRLVWMMLSQEAQVAAVTDSELTLRFSGPGPAGAFTGRDGKDLLARAIYETLGARLTVMVEVDGGPSGPGSRGGPSGPQDGPGPGLREGQPRQRPGDDRSADARRAPRGQAEEPAMSQAAAATTAPSLTAPAPTGTVPTTPAAAEPVEPVTPQPTPSAEPVSEEVARALADWDVPVPAGRVIRTAPREGQQASAPSASAPDMAPAPAARSVPEAAAAPNPVPDWVTEPPAEDDWTGPSADRQQPQEPQQHRSAQASAPAPASERTGAAAAARERLAPVIDLAARKQERTTRRETPAPWEDLTQEDFDSAEDVSVANGLVGAPLVAKLLGGVVIDEIVEGADGSGR